MHSPFKILRPPHTLQDEINLLVSQLPGVIEQFNARPLHPATEQSHARIRREIDLRFDLTQLRRPVSPARCVERLFNFRREHRHSEHHRREHRHSDPRHSDPRP